MFGHRQGISNLDWWEGAEKNFIFFSRLMTPRNSLPYSLSVDTLLAHILFIVKLDLYYVSESAHIYSYNICLFKLCLLFRSLVILPNLFHVLKFLFIMVILMNIYFPFFKFKIN